MPESRDSRESPPEFLSGLRQARRFQDRPIPPQTVEALLAAGRGPEPGDRSWDLIVIDDLSTRTALSRIGAFTSVLAQTPLAIVIVSDAATASSKANDESRAGDRIMQEAGRLGLGCGAGWFGTDDARREARDILGLPVSRSPWGAIGVGYPEATAPADESALDRARRTLDSLSPGKRPSGT